MIKITECGKTCLRADKDHMLYHAGLEVYTPKAYLFAAEEETQWTQVEASAVPPMEEDHEFA